MGSMKVTSLYKMFSSHSSKVTMIKTITLMRSMKKGRMSPPSRAISAEKDLLESQDNNLAKIKLKLA